MRPHHKPRRQPPPLAMLTQSRLKELLTYDPETGIFRRLVTTRGSAKRGSIPGGIGRVGVKIFLDGKHYLGHRLAWLYVYGEFPKHEIDHINRQRTDNSIANLRDVPRQNKYISGHPITTFEEFRRSIQGPHVGRLILIEPGTRFGRLVVSDAAPLRERRLQVFCDCDCGKRVLVYAYSLRRGERSSCGECRVGRHGDASSQLGGRRMTAEYRTWVNMKHRCNNPNAVYYGGRGISVCDRWNGVDGYECFLADMGRKPSPEHSIDRIDNDGNYEPGNCRWATAKEQRSNQRPARRAVVMQAAGRVRR